ncbi:MAG: hypothetical protein ACK46X_17965 [Candidatus Sericytochromatia bacterium]
MRSRLSTLLAVGMALALALAAAPAHAEAPPETWGWASGRSPWVAAGLSVVPSALLTGFALSEQAVDSPRTPLVLLVPLGFGLGQAYAGDPWRGTLVSLGGMAVEVGTLGLLGAALGSRGGNGGGGTGAILLVGLAATAGYGAWAAWDAHQVAEKRPTEPSPNLGPYTPAPQQP